MSATPGPVPAPADDGTGPARPAGAAAPERRSPLWPTGASRLVAVIGDPISHSLSPRLHNAAFDDLGLDWVSVAFRVRAGAADAALTGMRALGIAGLSVTMPHKEQAFACVDEATGVAARLGAVNCVTLRADGTLLGDSTDGEGLLASLRHAAGFDPAGRRCLVVGAGGAARAAVLALAGAGARQVVVVNRTPERAEAAAALAGPAGTVGSGAEAGDVDVVVQATPLGMAARGGAAGAGEGGLPVDPARLGPGQVVVDLVYHPLETPLLAAARARGATAVSGLGMLVHQAALALERWTGRTVAPGPLWVAAQAAVAAPG